MTVKKIESVIKKRLERIANIKERIKGLNAKIARLEKANAERKAKAKEIARAAKKKR